MAVAGSKATPADLKQTLKLFKAVGEAVSITGEDLLDAVTALSGSGPAFVYLFAESLIEGGVRGGLPQNLATQLAYATIGGAAAMLGESGLSARELRDMVISPGGTTLAGLGRARAAPLPRGGDHGGGDRHAAGARAGRGLRTPGSWGSSCDSSSSAVATDPRTALLTLYFWIVSPPPCSRG